MNILFVENHAIFTKTVIHAFLVDHEVTIAKTIAEARRRLSSTTFDVVLIDYDLDDGKGDELVRWIRQTQVQLKIVAVSAHEEGNQALLEAGADAECSKKSFRSIVQVIRACCP